MFRFGKKAERERVYLDYAAATPLRHDVIRAMAPYFSLSYGNPSAIHEEGRVARVAVEEARESVARTLRVRPDDIVFTSGGTEANNLGIFGVIESFKAEGRAYEDMEILTTAIEHPSVGEALQHLATRGVSVREAPLLEDGRIDPKAFKETLSDKTVLVTFAYANSEIGVVQDVKALARIVRKFRTEHASECPYLFLDASQAPLYLPIALDSLGADMMTLDAAKCYGPKGVGVLVCRKHVTLLPHLFGGGQERGIRPGTENVPLIVGCAEALRIAVDHREARSARTKEQQDYFFELLTTEIPDVVVNGSRESRIANNVNVSIPGIDGEFAVVTLDVHGVAASTRSACAGSHGAGSHVVAHLTGDLSRAASTIRFTLGEETTKKHIERAVQVLKEHVQKERVRHNPPTS